MRTRSSGRGLRHHRDRVGEHVLVAVDGVLLQAQGRELRQHLGGAAACRRRRQSPGLGSGAPRTASSSSCTAPRTGHEESSVAGRLPRGTTRAFRTPPVSARCRPAASAGSTPRDRHGDTGSIGRRAAPGPAGRDRGRPTRPPPGGRARRGVTRRRRGPDRRPRPVPRSSTAPTAGWRPASSTCTSTCGSPAARRRRPSRRAPGPPRSAASPRWWPCRTPSPPRTASRSSGRCGRPDGGPGCATSCPRRRSRSAAAGRQLVDFAALHAAGVRLFTDDGNEVADAALMRGRVRGHRPPARRGAGTAQRVPGAGRRRAPARGAGLGPPRPARAARRGGGDHGGPGPGAARATGGRLHVLHASCARTVELVAAARAEGLAVTMEVTPQHLTLTDEALRLRRRDVQGQPAAPLPGRRRRPAPGRGGRGRRRHRHRPRPPSAGGEGGALRRGAPRACWASRPRSASC